MANLLSELVDLLEPFTRTVNERQALLARAFASEEYLKDIVWDGVSARTFVINTCKLLTNEQIDGKPALWHLLEVVRGDVDEEKQVLIDELQVQIAAFVLPIPTSKMRVFLSYARADDEPFVKHLYDDLVARGFTVWWDRVSMPNRGLTFLQEIRDAIDAADRFVLVAGEYAFQSDYVRVEWEYALASCKPVNVALRKCAYVALPPELSNYDAPDFRDETSYPERLETLLRQLSEPIAPLGRLIGVPELPHKFLPRPSDMSRLRQLVIADVNKPTVISAEKRTTALEGMGGIGKSVLAAAFAYDCVVRRAFPHGIVWVNSGQKPSVRDLYQRLGVALGDNNANYPIDENICKTSVQNALNDKHCLIILDDVWELQVGKAFRDLIAGLPVRLLITTRQLLINDLLGAREHRVGLLDQAQAVELLSAWIGHDDPDLGKVAKQLGYLPLALKLAGARMFKDGLTGAEYATKFDRVSRMKLDRKSTERDENLDASIALGVEAVFGSDDVGKLLYYTFGIFPEDAHVPQMTVLRLWQHLRPDVEGFDLEDILTELVDLALVERYEDKTITLHDLLHSYTREKLGERYLQSQNDLLNAYNPDRAQPWHVAADVYLLDHMRHHMVEAGYKAEFYKLLAAGPDWMETKFRECSGDASYVTDLELAISDFRDPLDEDRLLSLVQLWAARQVVNARVVNCRDSDLEALVWLGRIKEALSYARLRNDYAEQLAGILTIHRTLEQRGTPLPSILDEAHMLLSRIQGKSRALALINLAIRLPSKQHPLAKLAFRELLDIAQQGNLEDCVEIKRLVAVLVAYDAFDVAFAVTYRTVADEQRAEILLSIAHTLIKDNDRRITVVFDALEKTIPYVQDSLRQLSLWGQLVEVAICVGDEQLNRVWNTFKTQMHQIRDMWVIEYAESLLGMIASALAKAHRFEEAKTVSSEINDPGRRELVLADLADELMNAGFVPEASDIVRKIRTSGAKVSTLCHLGIALAQNGNSRDAEAIWDEVQKIANRIDEPEKQGSALRDIACALGEISRYREAEEFARQIPNRQGQAATLARLAPALAKIGDERAGILFEEARAIQAEPQDVYPQISALIRTAVGLREVDANLANRVYSKAKEALELIAGSWQYEDLARDLTVALAEAGYFAEAETTASRIKDYWNRTCALNALAAALARVGDTHAQFIAHAATVFGNNIPDDWGRSRSLSYEASMLASRREHQAQALFDEARIATDGISNENRRAEALRMIVEAMTQSGFLEKARETALSIQGEETKKRALSCIAALTGDFVRALNILGVCSLDVFLYEIATWTFAVERLKTELSPELMMAVCRIAGWTRPDLLDMYRLLVSS